MRGRHRYVGTFSFTFSDPISVSSSIFCSLWLDADISKSALPDNTYSDLILMMPSKRQPYV